MAYRRFEQPEITFTPATLANPATVSTDEAQSVADLASVAGAEAKSEPPNPRSVAGLASVAGPELKAEGLACLSAGVIPATYRDAFTALCGACPAGVPRSRWEQAVYDAERFMREWGDTAERLGWTADDLFGLHPTVPLSRVDHMGLVWLLKGERVAELTETTARFDRGLAFYRRAVTTGAAR